MSKKEKWSRVLWWWVGLLAVMLLGIAIGGAWLSAIFGFLYGFITGPFNIAPFTFMIHN